jgi:uncharacterized membrane protein YphA (DoxX/SURF4 family)
MNTILRNPWLGLVSRLVVGGVFIYASLDKVLHPEAFARIVFNYHLVPAPLINLAAITLPWVELGVGLFLVLGIWTRASGLILTTLVVVFLIALSINWFRGVSLECGCFTVSSGAKGAIGDLIVRDLLLLLAAVHATFASRPLFWLTDRA